MAEGQKTCQKYETNQNLSNHLRRKTQRVNQKRKKYTENDVTFHDCNRLTK